MSTQALIQGDGEKPLKAKINLFKARKLSGNKQTREECGDWSTHCGRYNFPRCCERYECKNHYCAW
uniref:Conotoxin n=1 Tax=Conus betulinus TaxID=89764 RepID=A0A142C1N5_CONBE|nr:conotoxin [Conus betulinus]